MLCYVGYRETYYVLAMILGVLSVVLYCASRVVSSTRWKERLVDCSISLIISSIFCAFIGAMASSERLALLLSWLEE